LCQIIRTNYGALAHSIARLNFVHRHVVANSSIDRRAQPQIADERFAVLEFRRSLAIGRLQSDAPKALYNTEWWCDARLVQISSPTIQEALLGIVSMYDTKGATIPMTPRTCTNYVICYISALPSHWSSRFSYWTDLIFVTKLALR
jgi:hypothetical protein